MKKSRPTMRMVRAPIYLNCLHRSVGLALLSSLDETHIVDVCTKKICCICSRIRSLAQNWPGLVAVNSHHTTLHLGTIFQLDWPLLINKTSFCRFYESFSKIVIEEKNCTQQLCRFKLLCHLILIGLLIHPWIRLKLRVFFHVFS